MLPRSAVDPTALETITDAFADHVMLGGSFVVDETLHRVCFDVKGSIADPVSTGFGFAGLGLLSTIPTLFRVTFHHVTSASVPPESDNDLCLVSVRGDSSRVVIATDTGVAVLEGEGLEIEVDECGVCSKREWILSLGFAELTFSRPCSACGGAARPTTIELDRPLDATNDRSTTKLDSRGVQASRTTRPARLPECCA